MPYYVNYGYDPMYFLVIIAIVLSLIASAKVKSTYNKYAGVRSRSNITGSEAALKILNSQGIYDVSIEHIAGHLSDHYDPRTKTLRLSDGVFNSPSVAAVGIAAHECGHAVQHDSAYGPLKLRSAIVPVASIGSKLAWPVIMIGFLIGGSTGFLVQIGILLFSAAVFFQLVTLPVEFDASSRAVALLEQNGILYEEEVAQTKKVLTAAALTYVASAAVSVAQLLRLLSLMGGRRGD